MALRSRFGEAAPRSFAAASVGRTGFAMSDAELVERIRRSPQWQRAAAWGEPRPGHPEGTVGRHVAEQVLPFIERHYRDLPDYWSLVAIAYLHDIGKPAVDFRDGRLHGESHSVLSARIAAELGVPDRIVRVIERNDRSYSHWRKLLDKDGHWNAARWTADRRASFVREFHPDAVDLELLVRFHRADNGYRRAAVREEAEDPVLWFEQRLVAEGLLAQLPPEGKDQGLDWQRAGDP
jgi:putative nucleotidyltransferase with HDIG domain